MTIRIKPRSTAVSTDLPLGFEAGDNLTAGGHYVDDKGNPVDKGSLDRQLTREGAGSHTVTLTLQYRQPNDSISSPLRTTTVKQEVMGKMDAETLGRVVHAGVRAVYDKLRETGPSGLPSIPGHVADEEGEDDEESEDDGDEGDEFSGYDPQDYDYDAADYGTDSDSGTPGEVFVAAITVG